MPLNTPATDSNPQPLAIIWLTHTSRHSSIDETQPPAPTIEATDSMEQLRRTSQEGSARSTRIALAEVNAKAASAGSIISQAGADRASQQLWKAKAFTNRMHGIDKMNGEEDYLNWSFSIQQAAMDVRIDGHLTDSIPQPDQVNTEDHIDWKEERSALTGGIFSSISGTVLPHLKHLGLGTSPKALWNKLKWLYAGTDGNRLSGIWEEIITSSYPDSE
ncbi:hypothetical protein FRC11_003319, partial [Ceratobasidium sp. 423]